MLSASIATLVPLLLAGGGMVVVDLPGSKAGSAGDAVQQIRIEQRTKIRIRARPSPMPSEALFDSDQAPDRSRIKERKIGKCMVNPQIRGMTPRSDRQLLLFLRDRRVISVTLERACRAQDFYLGFYMARNSDGRLCVDRDNLLSRSGMRCKFKQMRELVVRGR